MFAPQSIIVYRNPAEAALWESGMMFPIMCGAVVAMAFSMIAGLILNALVRNSSGRVRSLLESDFGTILVVLSGIAGMLLTLKVMTP